MNNQIHASHILLMHEGSMRSTSARSQAEAQQQIQKIKDRLDEGAAFEALAREHSDCPSSTQGGDLGAFGRGQMVGEFEDAAFALDVGQISDVVVTPFGFHIIKRTA